MGLQPGKTYLFSAESESMSRVFPSNLPITIAQPSENQPYPDVHGINFTGIEQPNKITIAGSAFFEGEETPKQYKMLYKESPKLTATLFKHPMNDKPLKTVQVAASHTFEFTGLERDAQYEIHIKSMKSYMDTRHEQQTKIVITAAENLPFPKIILPLKGKGDQQEQGKQNQFIQSEI